MYKVYEFTKTTKEILILVMPNSESLFSVGLHCIGVIPPPKGEENDVDSNGWYWVHEQMFHGYNFVNDVKNITEKECEEFIGIKNYGSEPYFCTFDYNYYDENKDFKVGICSNSDGMIFRNSLQSIIKKLGLTHIEPNLIKVFVKRDRFAFND